MQGMDETFHVGVLHMLIPSLVSTFSHPAPPLPALRVDLVSKFR